MRNGNLMSLAVLAGLVVAQQASATLIAYEPFNYAAGTVTGGSGGTGWTNAWSNATWTVSSPGMSQESLAVDGGMASAASGDCQRNFAANSAAGYSSGSLWISFLAFTPAGSDAEFGFTNSSWAASYFGKPSWYGNYCANGNGGSVVATGNQALIVGRMDFNVGGTGEKIYLWAFRSGMETIPGSDPTDASAAATNTLSDVGSVYWIRTGVSGGATVDELRIGTTYADVVPVPEPASLGLVGATGLLMFRRRRV